MTATHIVISQPWKEDKVEKTENMKTHLKQLIAERQTLTESVVRRIAADELKETKTIKEQSLELFRTWISQNSDIKNIRLDERFLMRFLRAKKFSLVMAQQTLLKWLNIRRFYQEIASSLEYKYVEDILNNGYIMVSPVRDAQGRRVIIYDLDKFDGSKYTWHDHVRAHMIIYETLLEDETNQVTGFIHVGDIVGFRTSHVSAWSPIDFARIVKWGEEAMPMRNKEVHLMNMPTAVRYIYEFACNKLSQKIKSRLMIHSDPKLLVDHMEPACLPVTFGGLIKNEEMIAYTKQEIQKHSKSVINLNKMSILSTQGIISSKSGKNGSAQYHLQGSFRKLELD